MAGHDDWNDHWARYAETARRNPAQAMRHAAVVRLLIQHGFGADGRLLDFGSGQGDLLARIAGRYPTAEYAGIELSASGVAAARAKLPGAQFAVADLFRPPPELARFGAWATHAVCSEVLEHLDDPAGFLRQARRYLRPKAPLVVTVPSGPQSAFDRHIGHRRHFTKATLAAVLREAGLETATVRRIGFPFFNLYRCLVIARGRRLIRDVAADAEVGAGRSAAAAMRVFGFLFRFNLRGLPFGWQLVAVARNPAE